MLSSFRRSLHSHVRRYIQFHNLKIFIITISKLSSSKYNSYSIRSIHGEDNLLMITSKNNTVSFCAAKETSLGEKAILFYRLWD